MKRIISIIIAAAFVLPMLAQDAEVKEPAPKPQRDYSEFLPQAGDWTFGIALDPFTKFIGNMFNGTGNSILTGGGVVAQNPNTLTSNDIHGSGLWNGLASIMGAYMVTNNLGIKANIGINFNNRANRQYVVDDAALFVDPTSVAKAVDAQVRTQLALTAALGVEYHVGKRRVQGVFGIGAMYGNQMIDKLEYTYGNEITAYNTAPTNAGLSPVVPAAVAAAYPYMTSLRTKQVYASKGTHMAGIYGSIGVECFVAPKIALGANVNVRLCYEWTPQIANKYEGWNTLTGSKETITDLDTPMTNVGFSFDTNNLGANLYIAFYFGSKK
ncbi:MAG: hypothetical protein IJQ18_08030 [Paludibacteraceae bacterium]|nr:hypothetical protein [Paludibacteraceae bacterium]